ncbi:hypothetical protein [Streptomyces sp. NPDC051577]
MRTDHGNEAAEALARRLVVPPRRSGGQERYLDRYSIVATLKRFTDTR